MDTTEGNRTNTFKEFIDICKQDDRKIGDVLMNYENVNKDITFYFLTMAMTATTNVRFADKMLYEKLSDATTISEEAFAFLLFENNFKRWVYLAEKEILTEKIDRGEVVEQNTNEEENGDIPDVLYQRKVKMRKDKRETAGKWTDKGMERYNEMLQTVKNYRNSDWRQNFEDELQKMYEKDTDKSGKKKNKRNKDLNDEDNAKKQRVAATNMFDVMSL